MPEPVLDLMVFIDVICPWCYVGKRRLEKALAMIGPDAPIRVTWRPFELNPDMPPEGMERRLYRMRKFGSMERSQQLDAQLTDLGVQEGLRFRYDLMIRTPNTFNAHRLIWLAGQGGGQDAVVEALMRAYFTEGRDIGDSETLADVASQAGMDRAHTIDFLEGEDGAAEVRAYEDAARRAGISGVPAFIANRRPLLMGAQPPDVIASALRGVLDLTPAE
ncbi:MAG TPA: DsbA family oxidoreductase [Micropepsaceae bacterium]|nr:DsbA family oxidoreductase [Micropepsaceae bacterium]